MIKQMQKVQEIIQNIRSFQIPQISQDQQLTEFEKANFFYFLTAAELSNQKQRVGEQKDNTEEIILKKIKLVQNPNCDTEAEYQSFIFEQDARQKLPQDVEALTQDLNIMLNSIEDLKQYIGQLKTSKDEITNIDQKVIQNLNIMLQKENQNNQALASIMSGILFKEVAFEQRYQFFAEKFCLLLKQRASVWVATVEAPDIIFKFVRAAPVLKVPMIDLLKEFCDQAIAKNLMPVFERFAVVFKEIIETSTLRLEGLKSFISINAKYILDYVKTLDYKSHKEILTQEAINRVNMLPKIADHENAINFVIYIGCRQFQDSGHTKILTYITMQSKLITTPLIESIQQKLQKIRDHSATRLIFDNLSESIDDWTQLPIQILEMFVEFFLEKVKQGKEKDSSIFAYYFILTHQKLPCNEDLKGQVVKYLFESENLPLKSLSYLVDKMPLEILASMIDSERQSSQDVQVLLQRDDSRKLTIKLFKRFLNENDGLLKAKQYEILKIFLSLIKDYQPTKEILDYMFTSPFPSSINGVVAAIATNCFQSSKSPMQDEMRKIMEKQSYIENEQIRKCLLKYKEMYPQHFQQILSQLDDTRKSRLELNRII